MQKNVILAITGGVFSAAIVVLALSAPPGGNLVAYFATLPLFLVGLGLGMKEVCLAAGVGIGGVFLASGYATGLVFGAMHAMPTCLIVGQALRGIAGVDAETRARASGSLLCWIAAGAAVMAAIAAAAAARGDGIEAGVQALLAQALAQGMPMVEVDDRGVLVAMLAPVFVGFAGLVWVAMMVLNAVLAQSILARRGRNLLMTPCWSAITLPDWISWALVAVAAVALIGSGDLGYLAHNIVLILAFPFFAVGLAFIHIATRPLPARPLVLFLIYASLFLFVILAVIVTALGVVEEWVGVRRRLPAARDEEKLKWK